MVKKIFTKIEPLWLLALLAFPIILWLLPADFFDSGQSVCPSRVFFGVECFGCGSTRAIMHLHHFEIEDALYYNSGVFLIYPLLVLIWYVWVKASYGKVKTRFQTAQKED